MRSDERHKRRRPGGFPGRAGHGAGLLALLLLLAGCAGQQAIAPPPERMAEVAPAPSPAPDAAPARTVKRPQPKAEPRPRPATAQPARQAPPEPTPEPAPERGSEPALLPVPDPKSTAVPVDERPEAVVERMLFHYDYYPDADVYFDTVRHLYFYRNEQGWTMSVALPRSHQVRLDRRVRLQIPDALPYRRHGEHRLDQP